LVSKEIRGRGGLPRAHTAGALPIYVAILRKHGRKYYQRCQNTINNPAYALPTNQMLISTNLIFTLSTR